MTAGGSQQLRRYRRLIRSGATMMTACAETGIALAEARLIDAADRANPPPEEAFELLAATPAPACAPQQKDDDEMASRKPKDTPISGEVPKPDFDEADKIYNADIAPANKLQRQAMKDASDGWKAVKGLRVNVAGARTAYKIAGMEDAEQQAWLRSFNGVLAKKGVVLEADLVDQAQGKPPQNVVPIGEARRPQLATMAPHPSDDSDLVAAAEPLPVEGEQEAPAAEPAPEPEPENGNDDGDHAEQIAAE